MITSINKINTPDPREQDHYTEFLDIIKSHVIETLGTERIPLFMTDAPNLFDVYLNNLPEDGRSCYNCNTCKHFINKFGSLVTIDPETGNTTPLIWIDDVPEFFKKSMQEMINVINKSRVCAVFITDTPILGIQLTGVWEHLSVTLPDSYITRMKLYTSYELMCSKLESYKLISKSLSTYSQEVAAQACNLLSTNSLFRSDKCEAIAAEFYNLHFKVNSTNNQRNKQNLKWYYVATHSDGFCHISSSMIGTLMDDIVDGLSLESIQNRFAKKMDPLKYLIPQVAPSTGNIKQAEKIVAELGIQNSLKRRYAKLEEVKTIWKPSIDKQPNTPKSDGVFSHLIPKDNKGKQSPNLVGESVMTLDKFIKTVMPTALDVEFLIPFQRNTYCAIVTAEDPDAPPIIKWDSEDKRNPFSTYVYYNGSYPSDWNLIYPTCKVTGICYDPSVWGDDSEKDVNTVIFILDGAKDTKNVNMNIGNALFPEILIPELREVRSTIEAFSRDSKISGYDESSACGLQLSSIHPTFQNVKFRVTTSMGQHIYTIDRWD